MNDTVLMTISIITDMGSSRMPRSIQPSQSDYFQATRGGGNGDYNVIVLAPASVQEMADFVDLAFTLAFKYRNPAMILSDGVIGQMMEKVVLPPVINAPLPIFSDSLVSVARFSPGHFRRRTSRPVSYYALVESLPHSGHFFMIGVCCSIGVPHTGQKRLWLSQ